MKKLFHLWFNTVIPALLTLICFDSNASAYYISSSSGNDTHSFSEAQHANTPWKSLSKLNEAIPFLKPGDSILFKRGDSFYGSIIITTSGDAQRPIVFSCYGEGATPVITGFTKITTFNFSANNIWEAKVESQDLPITTVLVDGSKQALGRYPNFSENNSSYLTIASTGSNSITGPHTDQRDWKGAELVTRNNHWVIDRNLINSSSGSSIQYTPQTSNTLSKGYGYFIQSHPGTLDQKNEWYYNKEESNLGIYLGTQSISIPNIEVCTIDDLLRIQGSSNIVIDELVFLGGNNTAINIQQSSSISIKHCSIRFANNNAVFTKSTDHLTIENNQIIETNNTAIEVDNGNTIIIRNNEITKTGTIAGSGKGDAGSYEALLLSGNDQLISQNRIQNTGYIPITFRGDNIEVSRNEIIDFCIVKDDGGGIYTWNNLQNAPVHTKQIIRENIILDGKGAPHGTADGFALVHGIYMDDNSDHVSITKNTVARCAQYGLYIHNAHELTVDGNLLFDNNVQAAFIHDNIASYSPLRNIQFNSNICVAKTAAQKTAVFKSIKNDLREIGSFDNNRYCRPIEDNFSIEASWSSGWGMYDITGWQSLSGQDLHSSASPVSIAPYRVSSYASSNLFPNGTFNSNINNLYAYSAANNVNTTWTAVSPLDAGALQLTFPAIAGNGNKASVIAGIGKLVSGHHYLLKFDEAKASIPAFEVYLRQSKSPYGDLSLRKLTAVKSERTSAEVLLTANASSSDASIVFDIPEQASPLFIDNLTLREVNAIITNPDDSIRFIYNNTEREKYFPVDGYYVNASGTTHTGSITLPSFGSAVLIKKPASLGTLPVVFGNLKAIQQNDLVQLEWTYETTENTGFQKVERSADGIHFTAIADIAIKGTDYRFTDKTPLPAAYYRIGIYNSKDTTYSRSVFVHQLAADQNTAAIIAWPNPAHDTLNLELAKVISEYPADLSIYSMDGRMMKRMQAGGSRVNLDISSFPAGTYLVTATAGSKSCQVKFIKL